MNQIILKRITIFRTLSNFMAQAILFFLGVYFTQIELTGYQQGILFAIYPLVAILSAFPLGLLNDRMRPRTLITMGYLLIMAEYWVFTQTTTFLVLAGVIVVGALGSQINQISLDTLFYKVGDHQKPKEVGSYVGTYLGGSGLGVIVGGSLLEKVPFTELFAALSALALISALLSRLLLPKTEVFHFELNHYKQDLRKPTILVFATIILLWALHMSSEVTSYGLFLRENLGLTYTGMGLYMGISILTMILWARWASHLIHTGISLQKFLYWGLFLSGAGQIIMALAPLEISFLGRIAHEAGDAFMFVFMVHAIRKLFPKERSGGNSGAIRFIQMGALLVGSLIFAPLGKTMGNAYPLIITAGFSILAIPFAFRFRHFIKH